ncbi:MAG TPA: ATP-binding cassette domain-containing protein [Draconibacterium sp.]|nr:ATP-binding cassette domain-containing protein [Draconibacterium sp.]
MIWKNAFIKIRTSILLKEINLGLKKGDLLGIIGHNGSGKTVLAKALAGELAVSGEITDDGIFIKKRFVPFHSSLSLSNGGAVYRQQRWNKIDTELLPKVKDEIKACEDLVEAEKLFIQFGLDQLFESFIINLSNGEQRKLELLKALSAKPDLLVLDNAFTGLDSFSRSLLTQMLEKLISQRQTIVMTGLDVNDFPPSVDRFVVVEDGVMKGIYSREEVSTEKLEPVKLETDKIRWPDAGFTELIYLKNVSLKYGERTILDNINWKIKAGECWSLSGPNGSGKTSLLNLIFGDNPKAYGCNIRLFGKQKGTGESIWDIKARIGFVSPELHQYLPQKQSVTDVICSGFFETDNLFRKSTGYQRDVAKQWLKSLNHYEIGNRMFGELSTSAQRIVLFIRTLVKTPPLLIFDEPFQGLDKAHVRLLKDLINRIAAESNCTMIFVTHLPEELPECFNQHLRLNKGKVV